MTHNGPCLIVVGVLMLCMVDRASSQGRFVPLEVRAAQAAGTRSPDGRPGPRYWQNGAAYRISARVDTAEHAVYGREDVRYFNHSPDTLTSVILRVYPDLFRVGNARVFDLAVADIGQGMVLSSLTLDDQPVPNIAELDRHGSILSVPLHTPLAPGDTLRLQVVWHYKLPTVDTFKGGAYEDNTYFVANWYPQIAVYDDITGWDETEFHGALEHYDEFADFDVEISVPAGFLVWATGVLVNPEEVLSPTYFEGYKRGLVSDEVVTVVTGDDRDFHNVTLGSGPLTWHFTAANVTDVAFVTSGSWVWDVATLVVDSATGRRVTINAAYPEESPVYADAAAICRATIEYLSTEVPGVPYPFPSFTAFDGAFAMEYPMMADVDSDSRRWLFYHSLTHELAHMYLPFYVGTNQRKYAFMDEGWAQVLPMEVQNRVIQPVSERYNALYRLIRDYEAEAGREVTDRPPIVLSTNLDLNNYHNVNYDRPGVAYYFLKDLVGEDRFRGVLREFLRRWHHRHPTPDDFFNTVEDVLGEDLSWYWKPWFFELGYPDLAVAAVEVESDGSSVVVARVGNIPVPLRLMVTFDDASTLEVRETARIWEGGKTEYTVTVPGGKRVTEVLVSDRTIPDVDRANNLWSAAKGSRESGGSERPSSGPIGAVQSRCINQEDTCVAGVDFAGAWVPLLPHS